MADQIGHLAIKLTAGTAGLAAGLKAASSMVSSFGKSAGSAVQGMGKLGDDGSILGGLAAAFSGITATVATAGLAIGGFVAAAGAGLLGWAVMVAGQFEQTAMAFEVMIGDADKSKKFLDDLFQLAAVTPFEFKDLTTGAQRLMSVGMSVEQVLPLMTRLGDLAAASPKGMAEGFERISIAVQQMWGKQRVMTQEMNQLTEAGVPAWQALAQALGTDVKDAMAMVENRQVSAAQGINSLMQLAESSKYGNMMQRQSTTLFGFFSTLKDNFSFMLRDIGMATIEGFNLKGIVAGMTQAMGWIRTNIIPAITTVFTFVGRVGQTVFQLVTMLFGRLAVIVQPLWQDIVGVIGPLLEKGNEHFGTFVDRVKAGFGEFLDWISPYWKAVVGVLRGAFAALTQTVQALFGSNIVRGGVANMQAGLSSFAATVAPILNKVRDALIFVMIGAEFAFRNLPDIARLALTTVGSEVLGLVATIQDAFKDGLPGVINFMATLFGRVFDAILAKAKDTFFHIVTNMGNVMRNAPLIASGVRKFDDVWQPMKEGLDVKLDDLPDIGGGKIREMADQMKAEQEDLLAKLKPGWDQFLADRLGQVHKPEGRGAFGDFIAYGAEIGKGLLAESDRVWNEELKRRGENGAGAFRLPDDAGVFGFKFNKLGQIIDPNKVAKSIKELPNAMEANSKEAVSLVAKFRRGSADMKQKEDEKLALAKKQLEVEKEQEVTLKRLHDAVLKIKGGILVTF